jgi:subfamily B ATP-binding cassette protein HlyB/CyaB
MASAADSPKFEHLGLTRNVALWLLQGLCAIHRKAWSAELTSQQLPAPLTGRSLLAALAALGFDAALVTMPPPRLHRASFPLVVRLSAKLDDAPDTLGLVLQADAEHVLLVEQDDAAPRGSLGGMN